MLKLFSYLKILNFHCSPTLYHLKKETQEVFTESMFISVIFLDAFSIEGYFLYNWHPLFIS